MSAARIVALLFVPAALAACKKKESSPQPYLAYPAPAPATAPAPAPGGVPPPGAGTAASMGPALGFPCASDAELQCPFGRCVSGRCGGCSSAGDCKPGAQCVPTWLGQACLPGAGAPVGAAPAPATPATAAAPVPVAGDPFESARQRCVARTNDYRARTGAAPLARRPDREACGDTQARSDAASRTAHGAFGQCGERAQNECPGWAGEPEDVVERCLAMMFAEGPGAGPQHGHYVNMTEQSYRGVSCGMSRTSSGELWIVRNFYP